jgi:hypothetical protein
MRDDSQVNRATAFRLCVCLLAGIALACGDDSEAVSTTSTEGADSPTASAPSASPAPAASELYVDADGTVEPTGAMDELIALACGDGPVPDDLEIVFGEEPSTTDIVGTHVPHGLYTGNRVVRVLHERGRPHGRIHSELLARTHGRSLEPQFRATVHGSFSELARRKLWCATARDMASVPSLSIDCRATNAPVRTAVRVRTGGREWRRRIRGTAHCPWQILSGAERRFRSLVLGAPLMPVALLELPARAANDCALPTTPFSATVTFRPNGGAVDVTIDRSLVPDRVGRCIGNLVREIDVSDWIVAVKTDYFETRLVESEFYWREGRPLEPPRVDDY